MKNPQYAAVKVPATITALFWLTKVLTTAMGESLSDYLAVTSLIALALLGFFGLIAALWWQLRGERFRAPAYWTAVSMVAVTGTIAADALHVVLGIPYVVSTVFYAVVLAVVFWAWYRTEGTLSIHSIDTRRRELFYWATVMVTFALGTATGDLAASTLRLGYRDAGVVFAVLIVIPLVAWRAGRNAVACFWSAYVLTRPLGASFADWVGKPHSRTGLGFGDGTVSALLIVAIVLLVTWGIRVGDGVPPDDETPVGGELDSLAG